MKSWEMVTNRMSLDVAVCLISGGGTHTRVTSDGSFFSLSHLTHKMLDFGDACGPLIEGRCPAGACCSCAITAPYACVCLVGSMKSCISKNAADGPPSVRNCAAMFSPSPFCRDGACGPSVNAFCSWTRGVDRCCLKDINATTSLSLSGTCAPCSSVSHDALSKRLWVYDAASGWI